MTRTISIKKPKGIELNAPCAECGKKTVHKALAQVQLKFEDQDFTGYTDYYIVECGGCKTVSFCEESSNSEDIDYNLDGEPEHTVTQKVYPSRVAGRSLLADLQLIPHGVAGIYTQTHEAIAGKLSILAGIGLRAIVEAVCKEKGVKGRDLTSRIDGLVGEGVITKSGAEILHSIRLMGNDSAHEVKANTDDELTTALEVVEHLLLGVYVIPSKASKLRRKRPPPP